MKKIAPFFFIPFLFFLFSSSSSGKLDARIMKPVWESVDWHVLPTKHFQIHYPRGQKSLAETTALFAEQAYISISEKMSHDMSHVIPVFIYPSPARFQETNILDYELGEGTGGFTDSMKRRVVLPFSGAYDEFRHVLTHEIVHAFQYDILLGTGFQGFFSFAPQGQPPLWLVEGMAEYFSLGWDESCASYVREAALSETLPTIEEMTQYRVINQYVFYKGGQSVMHFIALTWGEKKIAEFLRAFRHRSNVDKATRTTFGISAREFEEKYRLWVKRSSYPHIAREFAEEGDLLTRHLEDQSYINLHPALSPDGKKIAYISIRNLVPSIVWQDISKRSNELNFSPEPPEHKKSKEKVIVKSYVRSSTHQLNLLKNRLSFSPDSRLLLFTVQSKGRDHLVIYDLEKEKEVKRYKPHFEAISEPSFSPDGKKIIFSAMLLGQSDLYLLDRASGNIERLTFDYYSEKHPSISPDGTHVVFSSNRGGQPHPDNANYHIYEMDLLQPQTSIQQLTFSEGKQNSPQYTSNGKSVLFLSDESGTFNLYRLDSTREKKSQLTNVAGTLSSYDESADGSRLAFTVFRRQGFDIALAQGSNSITDDLRFNTMDYEFSPYNPPAISGTGAYRSRPYEPWPQMDFIFFGAQYSSLAGFGGFGQANLSDYSGNHRVIAYANVLSGYDIYNFHVHYGYLKERTNWYGGVYQKINAYSIFSLSSLQSINDFLYYPAFISSSYELASYATAEYPLTHHLSVSGSFSIGRLEETYYIDERPSVKSNLQVARTGILYNNVIYGALGPIRGSHLGWVGEQSMDASGHDAVYNRESIDARTYFTFGRRYTLAGRMFYGQVFGKSRELFPFELGGYNTIRGFPLATIQGTQAFFGSLEFRFPFLDALLFGFPVPWILPGFSMVSFMDIGSATYDWTRWQGYNEEEMRLEDLKLAYGLGMRVLIVPGLLVKIDWATPWDLRTSLPVSKWEGTFSLGYQF